MLSDHTDVMAFLDEPVGLFYAWWRGDPIPSLASPNGVEIEAAPKDSGRLSEVDLAAGEVASRLRQGNSLYIARFDGAVVAYGWSAAGRVEIGELAISFDLPPGNRYLWDFVTLPAWRGQNIYPALLQSILRQEADAERFWVGHDLSNVASARGITKAGFRTVGEVHDLYGGGPVFVVAHDAPVERAQTAAELLELTLLSREPGQERI